MLHPYLCDIHSAYIICIYCYDNRGRCNELISYWQYIGIDKNEMADLYFSTTQSYEACKFYLSEFVGKH